jgi:hypothetical protein
MTANEMSQEQATVTPEAEREIMTKYEKDFDQTLREVYAKYLASWTPPDGSPTQ